MTEAQYNSAIAIYNPNGGHKTGKIYGLKGNDLTVTGGGGTRINKLGQVEEIPVRTNLVVKSFDYSNWNTEGNAITTVVNQVGIYGIQNTASLVNSTDTANYARIRLGIISAASGRIKVSVWIKKDNDETRFPNILFYFNPDGTAIVYLNTKTGAVSVASTPNNVYVIDRGLWWEVVCISATANNVRLEDVRINPAASTTFGVLDISATGSIILGHVSVTQSDVVQEAPIVTTGSGVTTIGTKIDYSTGQPAFLIEPTRTNAVLYSYDLTVSASHFYRNLGTATQVTLNQVGITGEPNTATLVEDLTTSDYAEVSTSIINFSDGIGKISVWIKKDTDQSRFPEIYSFFRLSGSLIESTSSQLNTVTGEWAYRQSNESLIYVLDRGDWWEMIHISNTTVNQAKIHIRPALGTTNGTYSNSAVGGIVVGHMSISQSSVVDETPIITNGAAVTRTKSHYETPITPIIEGGVYINFTHRSIGDNDNRYLFILTENGNFVSSRNAIFINNNTLNSIIENAVNSNVMTLNEGQEYKLYLKFKNNECKLFVNGNLEVTRTETVTTSKNNLLIGNYGGGSYPNNRQIYSTIYNFQVLPPITDAEAIALTTL